MDSLMNAFGGYGQSIAVSIVCGAMIGIGQHSAAFAMAFVTVAILSACEFLERTFHAMRRGVHARLGENGQKNSEPEVSNE